MTPQESVFSLSREQRQVERFLTRQLLRPRLPKEQRSAINAVLGNAKLVAMVAEDCYEGYCGTYGGDIVDSVIKFLQWLLDHADEIIAIVMKIVAMFESDE